MSVNFPNNNAKYSIILKKEFYVSRFSFKKEKLKAKYQNKKYGTWQFGPLCILYFKLKRILC